MLMIIRMKLREMVLLQCMSLVLLYSLVAYSLVYPSYCNAEDNSTGNLLTNPSFSDGTTGWVVTPGQSVTICPTCGSDGSSALKTGNESTAGGTVSQSVNLLDEITIEQLNGGGDITYGATVGSDTSNAYVPPCSGKFESDCRDSFSITMTITNSSGTVLHEYSHDFDQIVWTGLQMFSYTQTIPENTYTSAIATLELFGIDRGYYSGNYGPTFDSTNLSLAYTTALTTTVAELLTTVLDSISTSSIDSSVTETSEVSVTDNSGSQLESFTVEVSPSSGGSTPELQISPGATGEIAEITVELPQMEIPTASTEVQEVQAEAQVEQATSQIEAQVEQHSQTEAQSTPEQTASAPAPQSSPSSNQQASNSSPAAKAEAKTETKEEKKETKQQIATKIITKMIQKMDDSPASQGIQLALMNAIGVSYKDSVNLVDNPTWYQSTDMYNVPDLIDPSASAFSTAQDGIMNNMINSQYGR